MVNEYGNDSIVELKFPDTARDKVGMYLGDSSDNGFYHTLNEILDNSLDEFVIGAGDKIEVTINSKTGECSVQDYGRGIPFGKNKNGVSAMILAMTTLHAGGKHKNKDGKSSYKYSSGINGVGAAIVNGVSDYFYIKSIRNKEIGTAKWENGHLVQDLIINENKDNLPNGTFVSWKPSVKKDEFDDFNVFESGVCFEKEIIVNKLQFIPYLNIGLELILNFDDERIIFERQTKIENILNFGNQKLILDKSPSFKEELVLLLDKKTTNKKILTMEEFLKLPKSNISNFETKTSHIELTYNFTEGDTALVLNFANGIRINGGKPDQAFRYQFKQILNTYLQEQGKKLSFEVEDIFANLTFMLSVKINDPQFSGQTKDKLNNPESSVLTTHFSKKYINYWINRLSKSELDNMIKIIEVAKKIRETSKRIKDTEYKKVANLKENELQLKKGKLEDCLSNEKDKNELYIVEGDSAAGGIRTSRNNYYQAFIPLKGKPLNVFKKANRGKILKNAEIESLAYALGGLNEDFDIEKLKYHKIVILADADVDGAHIQALLLTFFFKFYPEIINAGYLYVALAPLYKIIKGKKIYWAWDNKERDDITKKLNNSYTITRNKGLGEMDPSDLFETTLNPQNRKFIQINGSDIKDLEINLDIYMGDSKEGKEKLKKIFKRFYEQNIESKTILEFS